MTLERADVSGFAHIVDLDDQNAQMQSVGRQALDGSSGMGSTENIAPQPLPTEARVRMDELFYGPFSRKHGLSVGDIDALVQGLNELHGEFDEQADMALLNTCLGMLLRGLHKKEIAQEVDLTPSEVNRMIAHFMRNVRRTIVPHRAESERRMATIIEEDRALAGRQPARLRVYTPSQPVNEVIEASKPAPAPKPAKKPAPPQKAPAQRVQPTNKKPTTTPPQTPKKGNERDSLVAKRMKEKAELNLGENRNLFTRALSRPDVDQTHFDEELSRSLREASDAGVIPEGYRVMLLDDLSYGLKEPRIKGSAHEARMFMFGLGKAFPGRLADDTLQNIHVMRGLFSLYGQRALTVGALEKGSHEKVPVRLLVAGAVTEVLDSATAANKNI